jgi:hypothetical protein
MLEHSINGVDGYDIHIGARKEHVEEFKKQFGDDFTIHEIKSTNGQADTVAQINEKLYQDDDYPVLVINSDQMFLYPLETFLAQVQEFEAGVLVFEGNRNPVFSYVDDFPVFQKAAEKQAISPWAIAGAFYFKSTDILHKAFKIQEPEQRQDDALLTRGESYLSHTLNFIEGAKLAVFTTPHKVIGWGTPEQLLSDPRVTHLKMAIE